MAQATRSMDPSDGHGTVGRCSIDQSHRFTDFSQSSLGAGACSHCFLAGSTFFSPEISGAFDNLPTDEKK
jgi:hypothetical protein